MRFVPGRAVSILTLSLLVLCLMCIPAVASHDGARPAKTGILLVAFGTSVPEARASFDAIEAAVEKAYPGVEVRWAFTSNIIRRKLLKETGERLDSVQTAMARMIDDGFTKVAVQSLHSIPGEEFHKKVIGVVNAMRAIPGGFDAIEIGQPLMSSPGDMELVADAVLATMPKDRKQGEAVVLMGHGTHHPGNVYYPGLQWYLAQRDPGIFVGTVEGTPNLDYVLARLKAAKAKTVWLRPLMSVAGDHAQNDMAGPEEDSWKSVLESKGYTVKTVLKGTAQYPEFADIWVSHIAAPMAALK